MTAAFPAALQGATAQAGPGGPPVASDAGRGRPELAARLGADDRLRLQALELERQRALPATAARHTPEQILAYLRSAEAP
jgi:hypothetical protein